MSQKRKKEKIMMRMSREPQFRISVASLRKSEIAVVSELFHGLNTNDIVVFT